MIFKCDCKEGPFHHVCKYCLKQWEGDYNDLSLTARKFQSSIWTLEDRLASAIEILRDCQMYVEAHAGKALCDRLAALLAEGKENK